MGEFLAPQLARCGSATDFLADKSSANFPVTDEIFACEDLGFDMSTDFLFLVKLVRDSEPPAAEILLKFSAGDVNFSEGDATGVCTLGSSLLDDFFNGDRVNALRRTWEGRLHRNQ